MTARTCPDRARQALLTGQPHMAMLYMTKALNIITKNRADQAGHDENHHR